MIAALIEVCLSLSNLSTDQRPTPGIHWFIFNAQSLGQTDRFLYTIKELPTWHFGHIYSRP